MVLKRSLVAKTIIILLVLSLIIPMMYIAQP